MIFATFGWMKWLFSILFTCSALFLNAQMELYRGDISFSKQIAYTIDRGQVYHGDIYSRVVMFTFSDGKMYSGSFPSMSNCLYTIEGNKVYLGDSKFSNDVIYTVEEGKVYRGNSTMFTDCVLTFEDNKIYMGDSTYPTDLLFTIGGKEELTIIELACIVGPY